MTGGPSPARLVVITGLSGAGRSTALAALEDLGFYCMDNLPPQACQAALDACKRDQVEKVALGIDVRVRGFLSEAVEALDQVKGDYDFSLLFLDASTAVLQTRFNSTRRPHPLRTMADGANSSLGVEQGVKLERERLVALRERATVVLDTSDMTVHDLRANVLELFRSRTPEGVGMLTRLVSFGFKYGSPKNCDTVFDVRFVPNPYFIPELSSLSGQDAEIVEFVKSKPEAVSFQEKVTELLRFLLPKYEAEGKSYLTVGFGCTGGRHRSVMIAEWVAESLRDQYPGIVVEHRDVQRAEKKRVWPAAHRGGAV